MNTISFFRQAVSLLLLSFVFFFSAAAQSNERKLGDLPVVEISTGVSLHVVSPEPILKVDISSHALSGDLLEKNVLRLKVIADSAYLLLRQASSTVVLTVIGETFIAQYKLVFVPPGLGEIPSLVNILPLHAQPLEVADVGLSTPMMKSYALTLLARRPLAAVRKAEAYGIQARVNQVYTVGDYVFLDISFENRTSLKYGIDELRFKIEDKKITKATNAQSIEIEPIWQLYQHHNFKRRYRNVFVLKKMTFPENKVLSIELTEKQVSGRTVVLKLKYGDVLKADTI